MEFEGPPTDASEPGTAGRPTSEPDHDRHRRQMEQSYDALEETIQHGFVHVLKIAVPLVIGVLVAAVGSYVLGGYLRDRAERRRIARQMKVVHAERVVRAERILGRRAGFRARHRSPALIEGPLSAHEASEIITGVLAEVEA